MKKWFVVQTNPKEDSIAASFLDQQGIGVYQPFMNKWVFHARKKTLKKYPLFPNYLFVHALPIEEDLHKIRWCRGVKRILINNNTPVPIDEEFIIQLRSIGDSSGIIAKPVDFKPGDLVRVSSGPLKDVYGIFDEWNSDKGRVKILVEMVNTKAKVMIDASLLEKG
jgi:transcriptional antiterminator RfaH